MYRLFVAISLPEDVKDEIQSLSYGLPGARWLDSDQTHLTLRFIGEVDGGRFGEIKETLAEVSFDPFSLSLQGVGHFPPRGMPRVLWVGVKAPDELAGIKSRIDSALRRTGVELEKRKFSPHITIARLKNTPKSRVAGFIAAHNLYQSREFEVDQYHLYSSVLTPKGAIHTLEVSYGLSE